MGAAVQVALVSLVVHFVVLYAGAMGCTCHLIPNHRSPLWPDVVLLVADLPAVEADYLAPR